MEKPDFTTGWNTLWGAVESAVPNLGTIMAVIGVAIIVLAIISYSWQKRRGGNFGQNTGALWGAIIFGVVMCAPSVVIPLLLTLDDVPAIADFVEASCGLSRR